MNAARPSLKLFLDEGVPISVGRCFEDHGHEVIYEQQALAPGAPDPLVCTASEENDAVLVAHDGDMRRLAQRRGIGNRRFRRLSLIKLSCRETRSAQRVKEAMSLIEHEWQYGQSKRDRRIFIEISDNVIRTIR